MKQFVLTRKSFLLQSGALLCSTLPASAQKAPQKSLPFPIGVWYEGGVGALRQNLIPEDPKQAAFLYRRDFADIAAHGINVVVVANSPPAHYKPLLDAAEAVGLRLVFEADFQGAVGGMINGKIPLSKEVAARAIRTTLRSMHDHPALWRLCLIDEPWKTNFERYAQLAQVLKQVSPRTPPFTTLIGAGYIEEFLTATQADGVAFDLYPYENTLPVGADEPLKDFEFHAIRAGLAGARHNADIWATIQAHALLKLPMTDTDKPDRDKLPPAPSSVPRQLRFPTPTELRCMTYLALAAGCRGVWWFYYQTQDFYYQRPEMPSLGKATMAGLVNKECKASDRWDEVKRLTAEIRLLAPILQTLRPVEIGHNIPVAEETNRLVSSSSGHLLQNAKGKDFVFAVNRNTVNAAEVSLRLRCVPRARAYVVTRIGEKSTITSQWRDGELHWSQSLPPGAGALYRVD